VIDFVSTFDLISLWTGSLMGGVLSDGLALTPDDFLTARCCLLAEYCGFSGLNPGDGWNAC
jgi:hypothetical protein